MKKILLSVLFCFPIFSWASSMTPLESARYLGEHDIIVNQSTQAEQYRINTSLDVQETSMYRLSDELIRQEALGVALRLKWLFLSDTYVCRDYFRDTTEWWVCRSAELAADHGIVTRANLNFRPRDTLTLAESLGIVMKALDISLSTTSTTTIAGNLPAWHKRIILTIQEKQIALDVRDDNGRVIALYDARVGAGISGFDMSHRLTRGQFFQVAVALLNYVEDENPTAHCATYTDGCNECSNDGSTTTCTERACIWQGIPQCYTCQAGYTLKDDRCVRSTQTSCVQEAGYAGGWFVAYPEDPNDFQCCAGLTRAERKDGSTLADAGYTCINQGDGICDARYESEYNSADCRTTACVREWWVVGNYSVAPEYQNIGTCCSGLTSVGSKDLSVGGPNICANIGDGYCDSRYESTGNSVDCRTTTTFDSSICQNYYDGCNSCSKTSNGTICTLKACMVNGPAYCTSYIPYVPKTQSADTTFLSKVITEMRNYASDLSCTTDTQCWWKMVGTKACGGPTSAIAYSTFNTDASLITSKGEYITNSEATFNTEYGIMSDCMYLQPPKNLECINNKCQ